MAGIELQINAEWAKEQTDLSPCFTCEETIYSDMNVFKMITSTGERDVVKLCNSCFEIMVEKWQE